VAAIAGVHMNDLKRLSLADPTLGKAESDALHEVIDSGWITMGERVQAFEEAFARMHEASEAEAVSSATAGLHLALVGLGIGPEDEVLVPSLTFVASANAVWYTGARPVLGDIESVQRPLLALDDARARLGPRTRAIILVHYGGWLCPMADWRAFADRHGIALVVDASHAPGLPGAVAGADAAVFSFYGNKNLTTAEGGMVVTGDSALAGRVRRLRSHGMTTLTWDRHAGHAFSYDVTDLGFNYRMDELRAALGLVQLERLPEWNRRRVALLECYRARFAETDTGIELPFEADEPTTGHLCPALLPEGTDRQAVMTGLREAVVQSSIHYPPIHTFSWYRSHLGETSLPVTEAFAARELSLPLHPGLDEADVDRVVEEVGVWL